MFALSLLVLVESRDATLTSGNAGPFAPVTEVKFAVDAELANHFSEDDYLVSKGAWAKLLKAARLSPALEHRAKQIRRKSLSCIYAERESASQPPSVFRCAPASRLIQRFFCADSRYAGLSGRRALTPICSLSLARSLSLSGSGSRKKVSAQQKDNMKQTSSLRDENTQLQEENRALLREIATIKVRHAAP